MDAERWREVRAVFDELVELEPARRAARLAEVEAADPELRRNVEALLRADVDAEARLAGVTLGSIAATQVADVLGLTGRSVSHFRILGPLGAGGMGVVYSAEDTRLGRAVALKLPLPAHRLDSSAKARFLHEARSVSALDHPSVCSVYEVGESEEGLLYLAMALYPGETLKVRLARGGTVPVPEAVGIARQVAQGLAAAHEAGIVHRDLKPANLMLLPTGGVKILDFGLAKVRDLSLTASGQLLGTAAYMSPEQIRGAPVDGRADLWALGVVLYEMLTGRQPFQGENEVSMAHAIVHQEPRRPSGLRAGIPPALEDLVLTLLEKQAARRPATAQAVDAALAAVERGHERGASAVRRWLRAGTRAGRRMGGWRVSAAALAFAFVLAGYVTVRTARSATEPSLLRTGVLAPRDRILIADFADLAGDPLLAAAVTEAFRVDLAESPLVRVLSPRQVRTALARMERSPDLALDDSLAREIAVREGVKAVVTGSVARVPGSYALSLQLLGAREGDLLVGLREAAADSTDLVGAVDRLSERLRARMGESIRDLRAETPLPQVTTASLPALRRLAEGNRLILAGDRPAAITRLEQAVALDSGFAAAWRTLGATYGDLAEEGRKVQALEHAIANQSRLAFRERWLTVASHAANVTWDGPLAMDAYRRLLERYPDDIPALNNLGLVLKNHRRFAEAESLFARGVAVDTTIAALPAGLVSCLLLQGDFEAARRALDAATRRFPGHFNLRLGEIYLEAARQDWERAERLAEDRLAVVDDTLGAIDGNETLAGIVMTQGRLAEAERYSTKVLRLSRLVGSPARHLSSSVRLGYLELRYRGSAARAVQRVESGLAAFPLDSIPEGDRPYQELARFFAAAGQPARARDLLDLASRTELGRRRAGSRMELSERLWSRGRIVLAEGRHQDAVTDLRPAAETHVCTICVLPDLARAHEAAGNPDSAVRAYERYLATPWEYRFEPDAVELGWTMRRLGELYERRGEPAKARDAHARLLRLWRRADRELQPVLSEVR